jgi:hypothetical protein
MSVPCLLKFVFTSKIKAAQQPAKVSVNKKLATRLKNYGNFVPGPRWRSSAFLKTRRVFSSTIDFPRVMLPP